MDGPASEEPGFGVRILLEADIAQGGGVAEELSGSRSKIGMVDEGEGEEGSG